MSLGEDKEITLPNDEVSLRALTSSDGRGSIVSYLWTQEAGPEPAKLEDKEASTLKVSGLKQGSYTFKVLVANNYGATASDSIDIKVNSSSSIDPDPAPSGNLLKNPGFEEGFGPWSNWENSYITSGEGSGASSSIKVIKKGGFSQTVYGLESFKKYKLVFKSRLESSGISAEGGIQFYDGNGKMISSKVVLVQSSDFKDHTVLVTVPSNVEYSLVYGYRSPGSAGAVIFDDFFLGSEGPNVKNKKPTVAAGDDLEITLPTDHVSISASASDEDGNITSYLWSQVDGPSTATLSGDKTKDLSVSNLIEGAYIFEVMVSDNDDATANSKVTVKVSPYTAPSPNPGPPDTPDVEIKGNAYYISSSMGDDSRSAEQAKNPATPWKTIEKVNQLGPSLKAGDGVVFKRGDTFYGTLKITQQGSESSPIKISSYGTGARPVLTSFQKLSGWSSLGNGVYEASYKGNASALNLLVINGQSHPFGRYPTSGHLQLDSGSHSSVTDSELPAGIDWTGGEIVVRRAKWILDRADIVSQSGKTLTLVRDSSRFTQSGVPVTSYEIGAGKEYFIQNHPATLKEFGNWAYDLASKKIQVYFGANNPSSFTVQVPSEDILVDISHSSYIEFSHLKLEGSANISMAIKRSPHISVKDSIVQFSGYEAINGFFAAHFTLEDSQVLNSQSNGLFINDDGTALTVRNNVFRDTGMVAGMSGSGDGHGIAINNFWGKGDNTLIENNKVINTGYVGIAFIGNNSTVRKNFIDSFCMVKSDGGAIYSYNGSDLDFKNLTVSDNIIVRNSNWPEQVQDDAVGIYMDDLTNHVTVENNSITGVGIGIYLHNTWNIDVRKNLSSNNRLQIKLSSDSNSLRPMQNNTIRENTFVLGGAEQGMINMIGVREPIKGLGSFSQNRYISPFGQPIQVKKYGSDWVPHNMSFQEWQQNYQQDTSSELEILGFQDYRIDSLDSPNKILNGTFDSDLSESYVWSENGDSSYKRLASSPINGNGGVEVTSPTVNSYFLGAKPISSEKTYIVRFKAKANKSALIEIFPQHAQSPYNALAGPQYVSLSSEVQEYELVVRPERSSSDVVLTIGDGVSGLKYILDDVEIYETTISEKGKRLSFIYNETSQAEELYRA